jgi:hypothetical protein
LFPDTQYEAVPGASQCLKHGRGAPNPALRPKKGRKTVKNMSKNPACWPFIGKNRIYVMKKFENFQKLKEIGNLSDVSVLIIMVKFFLKKHIRKINLPK